MASNKVKERESIYRQLIEKFQIENILELNFEEKLGFFFTAKTDIPHSKAVFQIPYEFMLTPYDDFPYKETLLKVLEKLGEKDLPLDVVIRNDTSQTVGTVPLQVRNNNQLLCALVLYIQRNAGPSQGLFRDRSELHRQFVDSFPMQAGLLDEWDDSSYTFYHHVSYMAQHKVDFQGFYDRFISTIREVVDEQDREEIIALFSNKDDLRHCLNLVNSRAFTLSYEKYLLISNQKDLKNTLRGVNKLRSSAP